MLLKRLRSARLASLVSGVNGRLNAGESGDLNI
jgi:hypothetical protein